MKHKIILDCDPGHDDALAILLAAHHPAIDLLAITTVAGNQSVEKTTRNALKICSLANLQHIPVARGMERPLLAVPQYAADIHGESGLDGPRIPEPVTEPIAQHAVDLLIELLLRSDENITLVATGPLTNIATAIRKEPAILPHIQRIALMGGAIGLGNVTPVAEFNIWFDPEAAAIVLGCGCPITMIPLEVTHQALATSDVLQRLRASGRTVAQVAADLLVFFAETYLQVFGFPSPPVHDPCAIAAIVMPEIMQMHKMRVEVETTGIWSRGQTVCDAYGKLGRPTNADVGYALDVPRFWELMINTLLTYD
jgi:inosine-uridine nucleoside N-ribohydrolase